MFLHRPTDLLRSYSSSDAHDECRRAACLRQQSQRTGNSHSRRETRDEQIRYLHQTVARRRFGPTRRTIESKTLPIDVSSLIACSTQVGDQILSINDETALGISREHAVNLLRSAAATNQVRLRIRHFSPQFSSSEYQKFLYEEKSTDEDEDRHQATPMNNEVKMRRSSRRHRHPPALPSQPAVVLPTYRHSTPNPVVEQTRGDLSSEAEQSLLQSKFRLLDLLELLKKSSPRLFARETNFIEQLTQNHPGHSSLLFSPFVP